MKLDKKNKNTAEEKLQRHVNNGTMVVFLIDAFIDYSTKHDDFEEKIVEYTEKLKTYIAATGSNFDDLSDVINSTVGFLATCPAFSLSELAAAGADFTKGEYEQFKKELEKLTSKRSEMLKLQPYLAAIGYKIVVMVQTKDPNIQKVVDEKIKKLMKSIIGSLVKVETMKAIEPSQKALALIETLKEHKITINLDGSINDPENLVENDRKKRERGSGEKGTSGENV